MRIEWFSGSPPAASSYHTHTTGTIFHTTSVDASGANGLRLKTERQFYQDGTNTIVPNWKLLQSGNSVESTIT